MLYKSILTSILVSLLLIACKTEHQFTFKTPKKVQINKLLELSVTEKNNAAIDSISYSIDGEKIKTDDGKFDIQNYKLGKHKVTALVFYENKTEKIDNTVYFLADAAPVIYDFKIINSYPHDINAFTQGLEFHNGVLYESTGQKRESSIRKVELKSGKVLEKVNLDDNYFGEGITIFNDKIYMLTWKQGFGLIYDLESLKNEGKFQYSKSLEGWGFTNDGKNLLKSDGTERIWVLNPETLKEETYIEAYTHKRKVEKLNELEYINGKIYANVWQRNSILIINPTSGKIEGIANLDGLHKKVKQHADLDVLNGIALDKKTNKLYVTGKNWDQLFEIELVKRH